MALRAPPAQDVVIVGATGDLSRRKLLPALFNLFLRDLLPEGRIIGHSRTDWTDEDFERAARESIVEFGPHEFDDRAWARFAERLTYVSTAGGFQEVGRRGKAPQRLVYLAVPASTYAGYITALADAGLQRGSRLVVEKPFGHDYASACDLDRLLHEHLREDQVFRIDHYLGKETVQNILVMRFGNSIFERVWNRDAIDHVQITIAEDIGIEGRGAFYEETGAMRDIVQNHALQILSLLAMEPPVAFRGEAVRDEKDKLLDSIRLADPANVVRGRYAAGKINGAAVAGYLEEEGVSPTSGTETYAAVRLEIDNWRWAGVPIFIRTGKRLARRDTDITISFKDVPKRFFEDIDCGEMPPNLLRIEVQPEEAVKLSVLAKVPGPEIEVKPVSMEFSYGHSFMVQPAEAYERLILDAMNGDQALFARADAVERSWRIVQPVLDALPPLYEYAAGSWGPPEAAGLIAPRHWYTH